jgi:Tfp pilus assembly PilM family ATPase
MAESTEQNGLRTIRLPFQRQKRPRTPAVVTALDIDGVTLRVCQASSGSASPAIERLASAPLEFPQDANRSDPAVLGPAIARALTKLRIKPGPVVFGVPRAQVVLRTLLLPPTRTAGELAGLVLFQAGRDLPFRAEDAVIDFQVRRTVEAPARTAAAPAPGAPAEPPEQRLEILVAAVKRETVEFHQQVADNAGLKLAALGFLPHAHARCIHACHVADQDAAFALVSLRPEEVSLEILSHEALLFSRGSAFAAPVVEAPAAADLADPSVLTPKPEPLSHVQFAVRETVRSLHAFSGSDPDTAVTKLVVAGATGLEADLTAALAARLGLPATHLDPASSLHLPANARAEAPGALAVLGLALGLADPAGMAFDFLNPKRPPVPQNLRRRRILLSLAAAAVLVAGIITLRATLVRRENAVLESVRAELAAAEKKRPIYRKTLQQSAAIDEWLKNDRDWTDLYAHLSTILPAADDIYLKAFTVTGQGSIRLAVQARSGETIARLDKQLRAAGYDVHPVAITPGTDRYGYDFASTVELIVPSKLKVDLHKLKSPARPTDDASLDPAVFKKGAAR